MGPRAVETTHAAASRRGAEAAARVAQRFAHAPSYRDILMQQPQVLRAEDAFHTPPAVEMTAEPTATEFETMGPAAAKLETAAEMPSPAELSGAEEPGSLRFAIEPRDRMPDQVRDQARAQSQAQTHDGARLFGAGVIEAPALEWSAKTTEEMADEAEPIHANLIEFPRELVATRKIRPRLVEGPLAATRDAQLSIFEVDPEAISIEAEPAEAKAAPDWNQPEWSGIKLDAQPEGESSAAAEAVVAVAAAPEIELAPLSRRLLAVFVDGTLVAAALIAAGAVSALNAATLPGPRQMGIAAVFGFMAAAILYELLFLTLSRATPGMRYAQIALTTFGNERPSREQRQKRLATMSLSVLPVGLGLLWSLFDDERLCWHDRLSQTYLKCS